MDSFRLWIIFSLLFVKVLHAASNDGKEIADRFGDDLSFASKQIIRGFTAIFGPILDTAHDFPKGFSKGLPSGTREASENFSRVLLRDGINAIGKGVKTSATILSSPARVAGTGLEEVLKVGRAGLESRMGTSAVIVKGSKANPGSDNIRRGIEDKTKIASTLLNTTAAQLSQANLGAVLVEVALKNRIKDIGNKTLSRIKPEVNIPADNTDTESRMEISATTEEDIPSTTSRVDFLIERFNEAVRQNDERVMDALKSILVQINPPKN